MKNKILVTGASGFIGSWVCRKLIDQNLIAVVSPFSKSGRLSDIEDRINIVKGDLSDKETVFKIFKKHKPLHVIHLATHGVYQYQQADEDKIVNDNYLMTVNLLNAAKLNNVEKFINTGSVFEYGSQKRKVKEIDVDLRDVINRYSAIKMATTALANSFNKELDVLTIRPFTTYGPLEDESRFIMATIGRSLKNEDLRIADGVVRDFVYVEDVARAYTQSLKTKFISGGIVNIAGGRKYTLKDAAEVIKRATKSKSKIVIDKTYVRRKESACWADISAAKKVIGWEPDYNLQSGIKKTVEFLKK